jgi:hypothetical protein
VLLERGFGSLWLEAEISNFASPSSGHWYFSLKDAGAGPLRHVPAANMLCKFTAKDGQKVLVRARIGLYEPRGEYQLIVDHMEDAGLGALQRQFEELRARLHAEGLFAVERKRPLPGLPTRIGIITSPTGAAVRDILHVLARRFPAVGVLIYPVPVQGARRRAKLSRHSNWRANAAEVRRVDPGPWRRLAGGSVELQRRGPGARHRGLPHSGDHRRRPRESISPSPTSPPTSAPPRPPPRRNWWCPMPTNGSRPV